ncbi:MAG: Farnesyl-diphosphate farnesyltransferase [Pseudonocardiales bacterium]|nr:Farnesyl-diphosphate farnesyltransferase [Pseudonocardiales bacterium]
MTDTTGKLSSAYAECERITKTEARNFSWGIRLLTPPKRKALSAVYALARRIDDIGDGTLPTEQKVVQLAAARDQIVNIREHLDDPVYLALNDAAQRFPIPLAAFGELVDGCEMDVRGHTYEDLDDLVGYCRNVAGSIGRLSLGVFAPPLSESDRVEANRLADSLGVALQLTNILRDVREDLGNGRVYLPSQDLALFKVDLGVLADGSLDPQDGRLAELVRFEAARAWGWYDDGLQLLALLDRRSAACCAAMAGIYRELLERIAANPKMMMTGRAALPTKDKLKVAGRALAGRHG